MITPKFTVSQTDDFVTIVIHAPYIKAQDVDMFVEGPEFKFYLKPYFLRLTFPGNVVEDERSQATYDVAKGDLTVVLAKEEPGQDFPDLDMLTKLLVRKGEIKDGKGAQAKRPLIEVVAGGETLEGKTIDKDEDYDWQLPQDVPQEELISEVRYGFNNLYNGFFTHVQETGNDALDVYDPEHATLEQRRANRTEREDAKFDDEYYMSEIMNEEEIQHILKFKTPWWHELRAIQRAEKEAGKPTADSGAMTTKEDHPSNPSPATLLSKDSSPAPLITPLDTPRTTSSTTLTRSSLLTIVPQDEEDNSEKSQHSGLESLGLQQVSTRPILISEASSSPPLIIPTLSATETTKSASTNRLATTVEDGSKEESLDQIKPSSPAGILINGSGLTQVKVIDPSRSARGADAGGEDNLASSLGQLSLASGADQKGAKPFTDKEQDLLRDLPKRECTSCLRVLHGNLLQNPKSTYLGLVDILFAYSYNLRVTEGENTVETPWTICKLSSTLAALDQFTTLRETVVASFRRMLAYPLYRGWSLALKVMQDVYVLLRLGRRGILRALLSVKEVLDHDDVYYIYSKMFIEDYCVWIQTASEKVLRTLAHELHHFEIQKSEIGWHLDELEALAKELPEESEDDDEEDSDEDSETSSDEDTSSEDGESSEEEEEGNKTKDQDKNTKDNNDLQEESIFMQEGPKPMIIELN